MGALSIPSSFEVETLQLTVYPFFLPRERSRLAHHKLRSSQKKGVARVFFKGRLQIHLFGASLFPLSAIAKSDFKKSLY